MADRVRLNFPLGNYGAPVITANTGFSITPAPTAGPPPSTTTTVISVTEHCLGSGLQGMPLTYVPAGVLVGGKVSGVAQAKPGFPNREQRLNECAPAAIVNSLQYLDAVFGLKLPEEAIRLQTIKDAMRWNASGAPVGDFPEIPEWVLGKAQHMTDRKLGIETVLTPSALDVITALRAMHDVEIVMAGHAACVVGIAQLEDGRYVLTLAHDVRQGKDGGNILEAVTFDPKNKRLEVEGTAWGREFLTFVIERPE